MENDVIPIGVEMKLQKKPKKNRNTMNNEESENTALRKKKVLNREQRIQWTTCF